MNAPIKRVYRSRTEKVLGGICGGLGRYFHVDPVLLRIIWVILGLSGVGIVAYIVCWIVIPLEPASTPAGTGAARPA